MGGSQKVKTRATVSDTKRREEDERLKGDTLGKLRCHVGVCFIHSHVQCGRADSLCSQPDKVKKKEKN